MSKSKDTEALIALLIVALVIASIGFFSLGRHEGFSNGYASGQTVEYNNVKSGISKLWNQYTSLDSQYNTLSTNYNKLRTATLQYIDATQFKQSQTITPIECNTNLTGTSTSTSCY